MIEKQLKDNTCKIICGKKDQGTGFLISNKLILTAFHVVKKYEKETIDITFESNDKEFNVKLHDLIDEKYKKLDIAILELDNFIENYNHIAIVDIPLNTKLEWQTRGYPSITSVAENILINNDTYINEQRSELHEQSDIHLNINKKLDDYSGFSGSPLIVNNNVVGIIKKKFDERGVSKELRGLSNKYFIELLEKVGVKVHNQFLIPLNKKNSLSDKLESNDIDFITRIFKQNFNKSLKSYTTQSNIWVEPIIHSRAEDDSNIDNKDIHISIDEIITVPKSLIIEARQQYGLTSLSHYFIKKAWINKNFFYLYLDAKDLKPHINAIEKIVLERLKEFNLQIEDIDTIILDEFSPSLKDASEILEKVSDFFRKKSLIVMWSNIDNPLGTKNIEQSILDRFDKYYLWALTRNHVREIVNKYNHEKSIGDENLVINKIVKDLEVLNIPRTPLNCLTILKISEAGFDDSPVNRTEMLGKILSLLFNTENLPRYRTRPDVKDTEYVLGFFSEKMIREKNYLFTRESFLNTLQEFSDDEEIELEIDVVFDILYENNIMIESNNEYRFKFSYWIFYFSAHRMYKNKDFLDYILSDMNYASYPEMIEFYTGIDRNRENALDIILKDLKSIRLEVEEKFGFKDNFNIYNIAQWKPSEERIKEMNEEVSESVSQSNLPSEVKDAYADKSYDRTRPLNQNINTILENYSMSKLIMGISSASKSLRNSDYTSTTIRHALLEEILQSWEQLIRVLIILTPILAKDNFVAYQGVAFRLNGDFGNSFEEKLKNIIPEIPRNVVMWYRDDLFSTKMKKLLFNRIDKTENRLTKHILNLLLVKKRPKNWGDKIEEYIVSENKNSFYLFDIYSLLQTEEEYSFATEGDLRTIRKLIKMTVTKHKLGIKEKPSKKVLKKEASTSIPINETEKAKEMMKNMLKRFGLK